MTILISDKEVESLCEMNLVDLCFDIQAIDSLLEEIDDNDYCVSDEIIFE